jgi:hypothetical protein
MRTKNIFINPFANQIFTRGGETDDEFRRKILEKLRENKLRKEKKQMYFTDLNPKDKITFTKREFSALVKSIFENPELLKIYVNEKKISNDQSQIVLKHIMKLNSKACVCCRKFDVGKLSMMPIEKDLEPLLDIAQANVKVKSY